MKLFIFNIFKSGAFPDIKICKILGDLIILFGILIQFIINGTGRDVTSDTPLGGSWVVTSRVMSRVTIVTTHFRGLITPFRNYPKP